jgi:hypothetical protein
MNSSENEKDKVNINARMTHSFSSSPGNVSAHSSNISLINNDNSISVVDNSNTSIKSNELIDINENNIISFFESNETKKIIKNNIKYWLLESVSISDSSSFFCQSSNISTFLSFIIFINKKIPIFLNCVRNVNNNNNNNDDSDILDTTTSKIPDFSPSVPVSSSYVVFYYLFKYLSFFFEQNYYEHVFDGSIDAVNLDDNINENLVNSSSNKNQNNNHTNSANEKIIISFYSSLVSSIPSSFIVLFPMLNFLLFQDSSSDGINSSLADSMVGFSSKSISYLSFYWKIPSKFPMRISSSMLLLLFPYTLMCILSSNGNIISLSMKKKGCHMLCKIFEVFIYLFFLWSNIMFLD